MKPWLWGNENLQMKRANDLPTLWVIFLLATIPFSVLILASSTAFLFDLLSVHDEQLVSLGNTVSTLAAAAYALLILNYWTRRPSGLRRVYYADSGLHWAPSSGELLHFAAFILLLDASDLVKLITDYFLGDARVWVSVGYFFLAMTFLLRLVLPILAHSQGWIEDNRETDPLVEEPSEFENPVVMSLMIGFALLIWYLVSSELMSWLQAVTGVQ